MALIHADHASIASDPVDLVSERLHDPVKELSSSETEDDDGVYEEEIDEINADELRRLAGSPRLEELPTTASSKTLQFSLNELRAAIPKHCFERSLATSTRYVAKDLFIINAFSYVAYCFHYSEPSTPSQLLFWPLYWLIQGTYFTALWILGHECGHHAFSTYAWVNDLVGVVIHSLFLTPHFSWKVAHTLRHTRIASDEHVDVRISMTRTECKTLADTLVDIPLYHLYQVLVVIVIGPRPRDLIIGDSCPTSSVKSNIHVSPHAMVFDNRENYLVILSDIGVGIVLANVMLLTFTLSAATMAKLFFGPYMVLNAFMVIITLLQHTDTFVPRFRSDSWTWLHGALCTVDRDFGVFLNNTLHHMPDTHVCHHIFSKVPFYHAVEATRALRPLLGRYYLKDATPIARAFCNKSL